MARVHRLQHIQRLASTHLAHDNAVRTHTQSVAHEVAHTDFALALDIRRTCFQRYQVILMQLQLGGVLQRHDTLRFRHIGRQHVEQRCFAGAGAAGNHDVQPAAHARLQELRHTLIKGAELNHFINREHITGEFTNRQAGAD